MINCFYDPVYVVHYVIYTPLSDTMATMKYLDGRELAGYIKERQAKAVRGLKQQWKVTPRLVIIQTTNNPVIETYVRLKKQYGEDIGVQVETHKITQRDVGELIDRLNNDQDVHGIIVQLPLEKPEETEGICAKVARQKDVDGLSGKSDLEPATPMAIMWLLAAYNVDLMSKKIVLVGRGKLVGAPLYEILTREGNDVSVVEIETENPNEIILSGDVVISAAGSPGVINTNNIKHQAVVVDAGVASEDGKTVGDASLDLYNRDDLTITPPKGGVGPVTICALFENVIIAARSSIK